MKSKEDRRKELVEQAERVISGVPASLDFRARVLGKAVALEYLTSLLLSERLEIDLSNSVLFGETTRALSFNQRFALLREMTAIDKDAKTRLTLLGEVRNRIAHNAMALSIMDCLRDNGRQWLMKRYAGDPMIINPTQVEQAFFKMADEAIVAVSDVLGQGKTHRDRTEDQNMAEARFNAHLKGISSGVLRTKGYIIGELLTSRKWDIKSIAYIPIMIKKDIEIETAKELRKL